MMFEDLSKVNVPFGLLDAETQAALKAHGGPYEWWHGVDWFTSERRPAWDVHFVYRVKPQPPTPREWWIYAGDLYPKYALALAQYGANPQNIIHVREVIE